MGGADRVGHKESSNAPAYVRAKRASLASFIKNLLVIWMTNGEILSFVVENGVYYNTHVEWR